MTRDLPGGGGEPSWGRWLRASAVRPSADAVSLLSGPEATPLLLLAERDKGRVGLLASDQVWLWARGFDGGGPHGPLLRRLAHWLMKEPDLEAEALRLASDGRTLTIERRTLAETVPPVILTDPAGRERTLALAAEAPGLWRASLPADVQGLWRAKQETLTALLHVGPADPLEFAAMRSTEARLAPLAAATGGSIRRLLGPGDERPNLPRVTVVEGSGPFVGAGAIGLSASRAVIATGAETIRLAAGLAAAALLLALLAAAWWREGR